MTNGTTPIESLRMKGLTARIAGNLNANQQQAEQYVNEPGPKTYHVALKQ
jgi:hypothetical protein